MGSDANDRQPLSDAPSDPNANPLSPPDKPTDDSQEDSRRRRRLLIGSQRDSYRPNPKRDQIPVVDPDAVAPPRPAPQSPVPAEATMPTSPAAPPAPQPAVQPPQIQQPTPPPPAPPQPVIVETVAPPKAAAPELEELPEEPALDMEKVRRQSTSPQPTTRQKVAPPSPRRKLSAELEQEFQEMLGDVSLEELISAGQDVSAQEALEPESKQKARVISVRRDDVFVELGGREQGILPLHQFPQPPAPGATLEVLVVRFNREDGLYELAMPGAAARIGDWSDLNEGMIVDAHVTAHNSGGLECEVNHIRGFMPVSQIALYRVENLEEFVGQKFTCLVTEANPDRGNLVLSRRAVLEREKEEARKTLMEELAPGQTRDGLVRKLMDFGAFVDLGGVDGLLHISQLAWGRVKHPSEVLHEGQRIKVRVDKVDREANRISLSYRDLTENPWTSVEQKYPANTPVHGKVTRIMDFGAFVELEPGVEGLVHISELSNKRVWRASDVVKEGEEVDVMVLSVDPQAQRISLSMKSLMPEPVAEKKEDPALAEPAQKSKPQASNRPLKGGLGRAGGGAQFGLKW